MISCAAPLQVDPDWLRCFPGCSHPGSMCWSASPSSLSPPAWHLPSFLSSPIRSLLLFLFSSPFLSAAVSFSLFVAPDVPFPGRFVPGPSSPGALRPQMFQSAAPGAPPDDPVRGFGSCSCPPWMLLSGASFCRILSVSSNAPVRGPGLTPGRSSPGASAALHSAPDAPIRGILYSYSLRCLGCSSPWHQVLSPDDPVRGLGPCSTPPRRLQSGASFCGILSVASDPPVRGTGFTPGRSSLGGSAVLHSAPDAPIRGVLLSYSLRCPGCSSPWHRVHPRTIQSGGFGRAPLRPGCSNPGRHSILLSLLSSAFACVVHWCFFFRAPIIVAPAPLPPLRFAFPPALSSPSPPPSPSVPFLSAPAPSPSLCGGFAGARTQAPSFYARMLLCFLGRAHTFILLLSFLPSLCSPALFPFTSLPLSHALCVAFAYFVTSTLLFVWGTHTSSDSYACSLPPSSSHSFCTLAARYLCMTPRVDTVGGGDKQRRPLPGTKKGGKEQ